MPYFTPFVIRGRQRTRRPGSGRTPISWCHWRINSRPSFPRPGTITPPSGPWSQARISGRGEEPGDDRLLAEALPVHTADQMRCPASSGSASVVTCRVVREQPSGGAAVACLAAASAVPGMLATDMNGSLALTSWPAE